MGVNFRMFCVGACCLVSPVSLEQGSFACMCSLVQLGTNHRGGPHASSLAVDKCERPAKIPCAAGKARSLSGSLHNASSAKQQRVAFVWRVFPPPLSAKEKKKTCTPISSLVRGDGKGWVATRG